VLYEASVADARLVAERRTLLETTARAATAVAQHAPSAAVLVFDERMRFVDAGGPALARNGWDFAMVRGRTPADVLPQVVYEQVIDHYEMALSGEESTLQIDTIDGERVMACSFAPVLDADGDVAGGIVVAHLLPPRPKREEAPRLLSGREREVVRLAALGFTSNEIAHELSLAVPTVETYVRKAGTRLGARNRAHTIALAIAQREIDVRGMSRPSGTPARPAQAAEPNSAVFDLSPMPMVVVDRDARFVAVNEAFTRRYGWTIEEVRGQNGLDRLLHPGDRASASALLARLLAGDKDLPGDIALRVAHRDGGWIRTAGSGAIAPDGSAVFAVLRPLAPAGAHPPAEDLLRAIAADAPVAVFVKDREYRYLYANHLLEEGLGAGPGGLIGQTDEAFLAPDVFDVVRAGDRRVLELGEVVRERETFCRAGVESTYVTAKFPLRDADGDVYALAGVSLPLERSSRASVSES
jgi:PAS domain S-box-containing protein